MASKRISDLTTASSANDADLLEIVQSGTNKQISKADLLSSITSPEITSPTITSPIVQTWSGWNVLNATLTRASADDPTYVLSIAGEDWTDRLSVGMKLWFQQDSASVYGIITAISFSTNTSITMYGGTDYDVEDTSSLPITAPYYSSMKAPYGFPLDPEKWSVTVTTSTLFQNATAAKNTWYNDTNLNINVPIGAWKIGYMITAQRSSVGVNTTYDVLKATLSTANNTAGPDRLTSSSYYDHPSATGYSVAGSFQAEAPVVLTTKATYYLNVLQDNSTVSTVAPLLVVNSVVPGTVYATSSYL